MTVSIKPLEWRDEPIPPSGETLAPSVVGLYCIPHSGNRFYLRFRDATTLGDYSTLDKAKAAAQADYEARIISALSAQGQETNCAKCGMKKHTPLRVDRMGGYVCLTCIDTALSAQVQDVAGWQDISTLEPKDGMIVMGWGEYRERDGFSPAFMRWYDSVGGWNVNAMPFYPTHWMPLPAAPAKQDG